MFMQDNKKVPRAEKKKVTRKPGALTTRIRPTVKFTFRATAALSPSCGRAETAVAQLPRSFLPGQRRTDGAGGRPVAG